MGRRKEPRELTIGCRCSIVADKGLKTEAIISGSVGYDEVIYTVVELSDTLVKVFWMVEG